MKLPIEIIHDILLNIKFSKVIMLFPRIAQHIYDPKIYTRGYSIKNKHIIKLSKI